MFCAVLTVLITLASPNQPTITVVDLGDSITVGTLHYLPNLLKAQIPNAQLIYLPDVNGQSTAYTLSNLEVWLTKLSGPVDVVRMAYGLHDIINCQDEDQPLKPDYSFSLAEMAEEIETNSVVTGCRVAVSNYQQNLRQIAGRFIDWNESFGAPPPIIIVDNTTPVPADYPSWRQEEFVLEYNQALKEAMQNYAQSEPRLFLGLGNLHDWVAMQISQQAPGTFQLPADVHFTGSGYRAIARWECKEIIANIKRYQQTNPNLPELPLTSSAKAVIVLAIVFWASRKL